jgi:hypothetical protein
MTMKNADSIPANFTDSSVKDLLTPRREDAKMKEKSSGALGMIVRGRDSPIPALSKLA